MCNLIVVKEVYYYDKGGDRVTRFMLILMVMLVLILNGCATENKGLQPIEDLPEKQTAIEPVEVPANPPKPDKNDYLLDIKGRSNQLTDSAWERMQVWREEVVDFSMGYENVYVNGPNEKMVALTFDDGPDAVITSDVIDILEEYHVKGNFFFVGSHVNQYPEVVKTAYEKGNLILSHSYQHIDLAQLELEELESQLENANAAIEAVIGKRPAIIRPPYGEINDGVADVMEQHGYTAVLWSIDTLDWSQQEADNIVKNVVDNVRNGDIILMHTTPEQSSTKNALPMIIEELQKRDYEMVGLDTLLDVEAYQ
jgi:peptidoglycan-N-acetylglucosamine deacetylase